LLEGLFRLGRHRCFLALSLSAHFNVFPTHLAKVLSASRRLDPRYFRALSMLDAPTRQRRQTRCRWHVCRFISVDRPEKPAAFYLECRALVDDSSGQHPL